MYQTFSFDHTVRFHFDHIMEPRCITKLFLEHDKSEKTENLLAECLGAFDGTKRMLSSKYGDQYRGELSDSLKGFIEDMQKLNDEKRAAKLLQTPLILFMSVLICWIAISILGKISVQWNSCQITIVKTYPLYRVICSLRNI